MKNKFTIISRFSIVALAFAFVCLAGAAQAKGKKAESGTAKTDKSQAASSLSAKDKSFIMDAAKDGMMEVEWGKWAAQNGQNPDVKKFGNRMVTDHSKANDELKSLAAKKAVKLPSHKTKGKWKSDKDYMDMMVKDHEKDVAAFQAEAKEGSDPDVKKFAEKTSKVLQKHLEMAKETQAKLK